jgi:CheY-like chemotaxis protein
LNILVADDNPVSLRFFAEALAQAGATCTLAADGLEAVAFAGQEHFDLLLLDARMPGLDGADALARIRGRPGPSRDARALATTAEASPSTREMLMRVGFADVIVKPIAVQALHAMLSRHDPDSLAPLPPDEPEAPLDDPRALSAAGGDATIVTALRALLIAELDGLPSEMERMAGSADVAALRDRLHRLDASAGFCGAPALARAGATLRTALDAAPGWPDAAAGEFLSVCQSVRALLARP